MDLHAPPGAVVPGRLPDPERYLRPPSCDLPDCDRSTKERKPYCPDHVDRHPYVAKLVEVIEAAEREMDAVRRRGSRAVTPDGLHAQEVLREVQAHGERTFKRLARDLRMEPRVVQDYCRALARQGLLEVGRNGRRDMVARTVALKASCCSEAACA